MQRWILAITLLLALVQPTGASPTPDLPPALPAPSATVTATRTPEPRPPVNEQDYAVITFAGVHITINYEPRPLQYADLWLMNMDTWAVMHYPIDARGFTRVYIPPGLIYWAMYPAQEYGNAGLCQSLRNAGSFISAAGVTGTINVVWWGNCDAGGER